MGGLEVEVASMESVGGLGRLGCVCMYVEEKVGR